MSDVPFPLIQEEFQQWLDQKPADAQVGVCEDINACVIGTYLQEKYERTFAVTWLDNANDAYYQVEGEFSTKQPLPEWARILANNFDDLIHCIHGPEITKIVYDMYMLK